MTIYSDAIGNKFLGDCIYANHDISYPSVNFLQAEPESLIIQGFSDLFTSVNADFVMNVSQSDWDNRNITSTFYGLSGIIFRVTFQGDTTADSTNKRYQWGGSHGVNVNTLPISHFGLRSYNNPLIPNTIINLYPTTGSQINNNLLYFGSTLGGAASVEINSTNCLFFQNNSLYSGIQVAGVSDGQSLAFFLTNTRFTGTPLPIPRFFYMGRLANINTNFNYYNQTNWVNDSIMMMTVQPSSTNFDVFINGKHFIGGTTKEILQIEEAQYPIVCSDGQSPTAQWATDFYVFDNNATLGYPAIGRVRNLLLATGSYTIGKPVKIQGVAMPDAGFNRWLPVGTFAGKTVLMRCYSSVDI